MLGHKQGEVGFAQRKPLPRSTANSAVSNYNCEMRMMKRASQKSSLSVLCALFYVLQNAKFPLCSVNRHVLKTCVGGTAPRILDIGSENGWILIITYRLLFPSEIGYSACYIGEGYHTASLEVEKIKYLLFPGFEHRFDNQAACKIFSQPFGGCSGPLYFHLIPFRCTKSLFANHIGNGERTLPSFLSVLWQLSVNLSSFLAPL